MATLNFNLLGLDRPGIAQRFMMGQQEAQAEAERNMLRQAQMQQIQQQNTLAAQQLAEYERARREEEGVRNYFAQARTAGADVTSPEFMRGLYGVSPKAAATYEQTVATRQKATTEEAARRAKLAIDKTAMYRNQVPNLKTREDAVKWIQAQVADPDMAGTPVTKVPLMDAVRGIPQDPAEFEQWKQRAGMTFDQFIDYNKPLVVGQSIMTRGGQIVATAPRPSQLLSPEEERQRIRIAQASRPPDSPKEPSKAVEVVDPNDPSKIIFVSAEEAIRRNLTPARAQEGLTVKERQRRDASYPQATSAVKGFETKSEQFIKDLERLRDDPGLNQITGPVYGRTPSVSAAGSRAQALYDKIFAKGGFQALQDMREASKTGGALGNVSNEEGRRLEKSVVGGLDRKQNINDVKQGINDLIAEIRTSQARVRDAYDMTYEYRQGAGGAPSPATAPAAAPASATAFPTPPAAAVDALKRGVGTDAQFDAIFGPGAAARARGR